MATPGENDKIQRPHSAPSDGSEEEDVISKFSQRGVQQSPPDVMSRLSTSCLPDEILLKVFSFLDIGTLLVCIKVSRLWETLASDPSLWRNIYIPESLCGLAWGTIAMTFGLFMRRLRTETCLLRETDLYKIISAAPNLEIIDIRFPPASDQILRCIGISCENLKRIHIHFADVVTTEGIDALCQKCKSLENIELEYVTIIDEGIESIARGCPHLKSIRVQGFLDFSPESLGMLAKSCPELQKVYLSDNSITDNHILELASNRSGLTHLSLIYCSEITNASLVVLGNHCPALEELNLSICHGLDHDGFAALARKCFHLKKLSLRGNGVTDRTIPVIVEHCTALAMLDLSFCEGVTDSSMISLGSSKSITHLHLCGNDQITDVGVSYLSRMKQLKVLRLKVCSSPSLVYDFTDICLK